MTEAVKKPAMRKRTPKTGSKQAGFAGIAHPLELDAWKEHPRILGMDEAGRGPVCGPCVVAGVIFPAGYTHPQINDSKKLSEKKREALYRQIVRDALDYQIRIIPESVIDELNIYRAVQKAMEDIAASLQADWIFSDAMPLPDFANSEAIVKGDSKSVSIAAASILAKVTRDHYMQILDAIYPMYGLARHKGYPTKAHLEAMEQFGVQDFYRRSYNPVARILEKEQELTLF